MSTSSWLSMRPVRISVGRVADGLVIDASAVVELLVSTPIGGAVGDRLQRQELHAPAHLDAEALSALGHLQRARSLTERDVTSRLRVLAEAPIERHALSPLLLGAWRKRKHLRLVDALSVELANQLALPLITTDRRLAVSTRVAELIEPRS